MVEPRQAADVLREGAAVGRRENAVRGLQRPLARPQHRPHVRLRKETARMISDDGASGTTMNTSQPPQSRKKLAQCCAGSQAGARTRSFLFRGVQRVV